jgi:glycine cleavage system H lipoate-binding protein
MSIILAIVAVVVLIAVDMLRRREHHAPEQAVFVKRYVHPGHTWARVTEDGYVAVGIDDFAQSLIGAVDEVRFPRLLRRLRQGETGFQLWHGNRLISLVSPVTGWVVEKNEMVLNNPSLLNTSPYGDGWLLKVKPIKWNAQLATLLTGKAFTHWQDLAKAQLARFFSGTPALMYHDGGVMVTNLADRCSDEEWQRVAKQFFLADQQ